MDDAAHTVTAREFNQNSSRILAAAERGEHITVTKNGRVVAVLRPAEAPHVLPYPTDPMGVDPEAPVFSSGRTPIDWSKGRRKYLKGFGQ